jgi:hypothetical protein
MNDVVVVHRFSLNYFQTLKQFLNGIVLSRLLLTICANIQIKLFSFCSVIKNPSSILVENTK